MIFFFISSFRGKSCSVGQFSNGLLDIGYMMRKFRLQAKFIILSIKSLLSE